MEVYFVIKLPPTLHGGEPTSDDAKSVLLRGDDGLPAYQEQE